MEQNYDVSNLSAEFIGFGCDDTQGPYAGAIIVIFDLDTADLVSKQICLISASCNNNTFKQYVLPEGNINQYSSSKNKLKIKLFGNDRRLFHDGKEVNAPSASVGLTNFLDFLSSQNDKVLLAAHSCFRFDGIAIVKEMKKHNLFDRFQSIVVEFIDTLPMFKSLLPERNQEKKKFGLEYLAADYIDANCIPQEENAVINVNILKLLIAKIGCTDAVMKQHVKNFDVFIQSMPENWKNREAGLQPLKNDQVSAAMLTKIAKAGISIDDLKDAYIRNGNDGVSMLLEENVSGKPRVTKNQRIIGSIVAGLSVL